ncbi:MAG: hypothetical protein JRG91_19190, partial [Deltaproteobacteria bacterium]|nr:hypothetical protein [Deltaproteobacteria bacterium]
PVLQADLRLDTFTLLPAPWDAYPKEAPAGKKYRDDYRLERLTGVLRPMKGLKITGGDFYAQFGNGIALSLRKVDELGLETVLRGGRIDGKWGLFSFTILGGVTNVNNIDQKDQYFAEDPLDRLVGVRTGVKTPGGRLKLGLHGVWLRPATEEISSENTWITGGNLDAVLVPGKLMMGFEGDFGWFDGADRHHEYTRTDEHTGYAFYLNLRAKMGPVSLLVEGKIYDTFSFLGSKRYDTDLVGIAYNQPPTAERMDQEVDNTSTVLGGRLKLDWRILPTLSVYGNFGGGDYVSLSDIIRYSGTGQVAYHKSQYLHAYGGLDMRWSQNRSSFAISGGYRSEREPKARADLDLGWKQNKSLIHGEAKLNLFLHKDWNLHATFLHEHHTKLDLGDELGYEWGTHILGFDWAGVLDVSGGFEYDTDPITADWYGFGMVKWYIRSNLIWAVFAGTQRGGLKCVGGVCKIVPPFAGVRTELVFRY